MNVCVPSCWRPLSTITSSGSSTAASSSGNAPFHTKLIDGVPIKKMMSLNGSYYEGQLVNGMRQGYGAYVQVSGARYEGQWKDGKSHGEGKLTLL
jgi:hypothetical protein